MPSDQICVEVAQVTIFDCRDLRKYKYLETELEADLISTQNITSSK